MKKIVIGLILLMSFALTFVYLFIPGRIRSEAIVSLGVPMSAVSRTLVDNNNWKKWWPGDIPFHYNEQAYSIHGIIFNSFVVDISQHRDTINSKMDLLFITADSITIHWHAEQMSSNNPFKRIKQYRHANATERNMKAILQKMKTFFEKTETLYGFTVKNTIVTDSVLISTRRSFDHRPTVPEIDSMIQNLKKYIRKNKAVEKNLPMLNVKQIHDSHYEAMTAIAIDKLLPQTNEFAPKFFLKGGSILEAEIKGGEHTIESAFKELENYVSDYKYSSPAIPYQL